jgi:hypothetical protein
MAIYQVRPGFSVFKNGFSYIGGQSVDLTAVEFAHHKHKLENTQSTVAQGIYNNNSNNGGQYTNITLTIPAQIWTDFGSATEVKEWQVLANDGEGSLPGVSPGTREARSDLTDSFEYRQFQGKWQIFSLIAQNNLQIILEQP